jgi:uncharacterized protein (UPF0333 family)
MDNSALMNSKLKGQVTLEVALVFVALILLLFGILNFWLNFNQNLVQRQPPYNATRVAAGSSEPGKWPVSTQKPLTEDVVFGGK